MTCSGSHAVTNAASEATCLESADLCAKVNYVVHSSLLSRGQQHLLVHCEGIHAHKGFLDRRRTARSGGEEKAPSPFQQRGVRGVLHAVL